MEENLNTFSPESLNSNFLKMRSGLDDNQSNFLNPKSSTNLNYRYA